MRGAKEAGSSEVVNYFHLISLINDLFFRFDYSIELWNYINAPFIERVIPGNVESAIEQICWAGSRLFSVSNSGDGLKEWDLKTLSVKRRLLLTGEKGICMDYHSGSGMLVIGTEEGIINVFDTSDDDLQFSKLLDRQDHRIVCCKFNSTGDRLISGSIDAVKVWNVSTGHVIHKMSTGRVNIHNDTIVWSVDVLKDMTIITGDSRGRLTFWDGNLGTQIDWVQASIADILCLSVSSDEKQIFCSGVEQLVRKYMKINTQGHDQWIRCAKKYRLHSHDIMAMTSIGDDEIVTSGIDGFLTRCDYDLKVIERMGPFLRNPFAKIAQDARLIMMMYTNYLEIWKLATGSDEEEEEEKNCQSESDDEEDEVIKAFKAKPSATSNLKITSFPEKFLELRSQKDEMILTSAISSNGKFIAYSTENSIRFFHFDLENGKPQLMRVKNLPEELQPCTQMAFSGDFLVTINEKCSIFDLSASTIEHLQTIDLESHHLDLVHLLEASQCGKYLAIGSLCNNISMWCLKKGKFVHLKNLTRHSCPATSLKFHKNQPVLVIAFSDNKICEYNLEEFLITDSIAAFGDARKNAIAHICLDPNNPNAIIFNQNHSIVVANKACSEENVSKKKKRNEAVTKNEAPKTIKVMSKLENVSDFFFLQKLRNS